MNRAEKIRKGICTYCSDPAVDGCERCAYHRLRMQEYSKKWYAEKMAAGLCVCGGFPIKGQTRCAECVDKYAKYTAQLKREKKCVVCAKPAAPGKTRCNACAWRNYTREVRYGAKDRVRPIPINVSDMVLRKIAKMPCHFCGGMDERGFNGIDCKIRDLGYTHGNMLPCCWLHNRMKGSISYDLFIAGLRSAAKYLGIEET